MYIHVLGPSGIPTGYFQIDGPSGFLFVELGIDQTYSGTLTYKPVVNGKAAVAEAPGFSAWIEGFYFPFQEGQEFTIKIDGFPFKGVAKPFPPQNPIRNPLGTGRPAPPAARVVKRLVCENVLTVTLLEGPDGSMFFSAMSQISRALCEGSMGFDGSKWTLLAGAKEYADLVGLDAKLNATDPQGIRIVTRFGKTWPLVITSDSPAGLLRPVTIRRHSHFSRQPA